MTRTSGRHPRHSAVSRTSCRCEAVLQACLPGRRYPHPRRAIPLRLGHASVQIDQSAGERVARTKLDVVRTE